MHVCVCLKYVNTVDVVVHIKNLGKTKYNISSRNQYYWVRVLSLKPYVHKKQINLHEKMVVGLDDHKSMTDWWIDRSKVGIKEEVKEGCWIKLLIPFM